jgi:hypothetical protein
MPAEIDIVATSHGLARPVAVLGHGGRNVTFHSYPSSRFGFPLSLAEFEKAAGTIQRMSVHLLFNTWIGLVYHYLANPG